MSMLHPEKNSSADATWMESIISAQMPSAVRPFGGFIQQSTTFCSEGSKSSTMAFIQKCISVPYVFCLETGNTWKLFVTWFLQQLQQTWEKKKNKWWVSWWRHSLKERSKQRCLWKCGWNGALKSLLLSAQIHHTHEETFSERRIHAEHIGSSLIAARPGQAQWCKRSYLNCMGSIVVLDIPLRLSLISAD